MIGTAIASTDRWVSGLDPGTPSCSLPSTVNLIVRERPLYHVAAMLAPLPWLVSYSAAMVLDFQESGRVTAMMRRACRSSSRPGLPAEAGGRAAISWNCFGHVTQDRSALLIAPTGGGKTLAGFLPSLIELDATPPRERARRRGFHTLYISPLKALAVDVARNLEQPITEMDLGLDVETRTGDTPQSRRQRQLRHPPDILMTTPEQVALLIASGNGDHLFSNLRMIVLDELHALAPNKRGTLLSLGLARLMQIAPHCRRIGLSATVADPDALRAYLMPQPLNGPPALSEIVLGDPGVTPDISVLASQERVPWSGHSARYAMADIYRAIQDNNLVLVFVNTRSQAELIFQELWTINEDALPIALHHGSLDVGQRRKVEAAMADGRLKAVVCTSTLDLGIDWGDVDLVINVGAPKGASRLLQRIGRANHRLDEPSRALLVPANRFEVLECRAAQQAAELGEQDSPPPMAMKFDVLAQHVLGMACAEPFDPDRLYERNLLGFGLCGIDPRRFRSGGRFRRHRRLCAQDL